MIAQPLVFFSGLGIGFPRSAFGCDDLTQHFNHCIEDTPWAQGVWEQGEASASPDLDTTAYEGFAQFTGSDKQTLRRAALDLLLRQTIDQHPERKTPLRDERATQDLRIVPVIPTDVGHLGQQLINAGTIAQAPDNQRIKLSVRAPIGTALVEMDRLSRTHSALVKPLTDPEGI
jgi:hypothetical protein